VALAGRRHGALGQTAKVALHDLTGFEGRCDAYRLQLSPSFARRRNRPRWPAFRREALGPAKKPEEAAPTFWWSRAAHGRDGRRAFGGAQRLKVALVQDRPVLGGNASSEVRVWPPGRRARRPYRHIGEIVEEFSPKGGPGCHNAGPGTCFDDGGKLALVRAEPRITLLAGRARQRSRGAKGGSSRWLRRTSARPPHAVAAALFADCTGDGAVGFLAKADYEQAKEGVMGASNLWNLLNQSDDKQMLACECKDKDALSSRFSAGKVEAPFPRCRGPSISAPSPFQEGRAIPPQATPDLLKNLGEWFWESGFDKDSATDIERIRDLNNARHVRGVGNALKNTDKLYPNYRLAGPPSSPAKRESRRLLGDVILGSRRLPQGARFSPTPASPARGTSTCIRPTRATAGGTPATSSSPRSRTARSTASGALLGAYRCSTAATSAPLHGGARHQTSRTRPSAPSGS
jgi:hypothetical protein